MLFIAESCWSREPGSARPYVHPTIIISYCYLNTVYLRLSVERESFRWIQKYIGQFGGDPTKVTM